MTVIDLVIATVGWLVVFGVFMLLFEAIRRLIWAFKKWQVWDLFCECGFWACVAILALSLVAYPFLWITSNVPSRSSYDSGAGECSGVSYRGYDVDC